VRGAAIIWSQKAGSANKISYFSNSKSAQFMRGRFSA
jgi:hypothetical protein